MVLGPLPSNDQKVCRHYDVEWDQWYYKPHVKLFLTIINNTGLSTSLFYVKRDRNETALGALIGWFTRTGQLEHRTRYLFELRKRKTDS